MEVGRRDGTVSGWVDRNAQWPKTLWSGVRRTVGEPESAIPFPPLPASPTAAPKRFHRAVRPHGDHDTFTLLTTHSPMSTVHSLLSAAHCILSAVRLRHLPPAAPPHADALPSPASRAPTTTTTTVRRRHFSSITHSHPKSRVYHCVWVVERRTSALTVTARESPLSPIPIPHICVLIVECCALSRVRGDPAAWGARMLTSRVIAFSGSAGGLPHARVRERAGGKHVRVIARRLVFVLLDIRRAP